MKAINSTAYILKITINGGSRAKLLPVLARAANTTVASLVSILPWFDLPLTHSLTLSITFSHSLSLLLFLIHVRYWIVPTRLSAITNECSATTFIFFIYLFSFSFSYPCACQLKEEKCHFSSRSFPTVRDYCPIFVVEHAIIKYPDSLVS